MKHNRAVVAGHICLDITPLFASQKLRSTISDTLTPGKLIEMREADIHTGGVVSNTGLAMNFLGADVTLMAKVGEDYFGRLITDIIKEHNVAYTFASSQIPSSYSVVISPPGIDRIFLHNPGSNDSFTGEDLDYEKIAEAQLFHFGYPPIMKMMYEDNGKELVKIFRTVKKLGLVSSLDMAAIDPDSASGKANWRFILESVLPFVDLFLPSIEELLYMLDKKRYKELQNGSRLDVEKDIAPLADQLLSMGAKGVIIKCGAPGIYYSFAEMKKLSEIESVVAQDMSGWAGQRGFVKSFTAERVLSATGAGDTTIAAFLTAFLMAKPLEECLELAVASGTSCVEAYDALSGLQSFDALRRKIKKGWERNQTLL